MIEFLPMPDFSNWSSIVIIINVNCFVSLIWLKMCIKTGPEGRYPAD